MLLKPAAYSPEELHLLRSVLERCAADLEPSRRSSEIKPAMAGRILGCAAIGERNPTKLRIAAMRGRDRIVRTSVLLQQSERGNSPSE